MVDANSTTAQSAVDASTAEFACKCCAVWDVIRGPHAGERVVISVEEQTPSAVKIGRQSQCWLRLRKDLEVSGLHAELNASREANETLKLELIDRKSTNGSRINGGVLVAMEKYTVQHQDLVQFGRSTARVQFGDTMCKRGVPYQPLTSVTVEEPTKEPTPTGDNPDKIIAVDEEDFDAPSTAHPISMPQPSLIQNCIVCGEALHGWSVLEQQLHVNACLDKGTAPPPHRPPTRPSSASAAVTTASHNSGRKRKRPMRPEEEDLAVATAMSKSLVDDTQRVDVEFALVSGELAQVDAQLKKLTKKRLALVKKLEKLEKQKRKVHKGDVRDPVEVGVLFDWKLAMSVLFPQHREWVATNCAREPRTSRLTAFYRTKPELEVGEFVGMWRRAAQPGANPEGTNPEEEDMLEPLFTTALLRRLLEKAKAPPALGEPRQRGEEVEEDRVPATVKRVFPNWRENLEFLRTQEEDDLKNALVEMRHRREEGFHDSGGEEEEGRGELVAACVFFEQEISRLLADTVDKPRRYAEEGEVIEVEDSQDNEADPVTEHAAVGPALGGPQSVGTAERRTERQITERTGELLHPVEVHQESSVSSSPAPLLQDDTSSDGDEALAADNVDSPHFSGTADSPSRASLGGDPATLEQQLLSALKANAPLYESVLLLQPLDLPSALRYFREDAGIVCPKAALIRFCDQHGITFKNG